MWERFNKLNYSDENKLDERGNILYISQIVIELVRKSLLLTLYVEPQKKTKYSSYLQ